MTCIANVGFFLKRPFLFKLVVIMLHITSAYATIHIARQPEPHQSAMEQDISKAKLSGKIKGLIVFEVCKRVVISIFSESVRCSEFHSLSFGNWHDAPFLLFGFIRCM